MIALPVAPEPVSGLVRVDGKHFATPEGRFHVRGVAYGTFRPRSDGERFPEPEQVEHDFAAMEQAGFTAVRVYTVPPDDVVQAAGRHHLRLLVGVFYRDWRYLVGRGGRRDRAAIAREARAAAAEAAQRFVGDERILALSLGNEVPADVLRWLGPATVSRVLADMASVVRDIDPQRLVTYGSYPTAEYLPVDFLDFLTVNVFLEEPQDLRRYLSHLHQVAGDRPLVIGELGLNVPDTEEGEAEQAESIARQIQTALERGTAGTFVFSWTDEWWVGDAPVEGWRFGLTRADRSPRPALNAVAAWNRRTVADLDFPWPAISVVVCAYNAEATLDECLRHTCTLDYPGLEVIVVDDGSSDRTAEIARCHPRARLVQIEHGGLSVARNVGLEEAAGEVVAYLDSDAYPAPEWPYYLALALDSPSVAGSGGPNLPPPCDPLGAQRVARAPGGPIHVLLRDDRAEHVPGCNMAFWRQVLIDADGFDPVFTAAGDDVDLCWRVTAGGWDIGFHPAALVWHHPRASVRAYLRQQRGYGHSEALVETRHPERFTPLGTARWHGTAFDMLGSVRAPQRIYRGPFGAAAFQSVYQAGGYGWDLAHQVGVPVATLLLGTLPLGLLHPVAAVPALAAAAMLAIVFIGDVLRIRPPRRPVGSALRFRAAVALLHLLQPLARAWGRRFARSTARRQSPPPQPLPASAHTVAGGALLLPLDRPRAELTAALVGHLRRAGLRPILAAEWADHDARLHGSILLHGELVTSAHPEGWVHARVRSRLGLRVMCLALTLTFAAAVVRPVFAAVIAAAVAADVVRGGWRLGPRFRQAVRRAATPASEGVPHSAPRLSRSGFEVAP